MKPASAALRASAISMCIAYLSSISDMPIDKDDKDVREIMGDVIDSAGGGILIDETSWSYVKDRMLYDIYLMSRKEEDTITDYDLIRPGITVAMFADPFEFNNHNKRVSDKKLRDHGPIDESEIKVCRECGFAKPKSKYRKGGGAVCNACRCAAHRRNRKGTDDVTNELPD